ncbi:hypothetical protein Tco_0073234 [Tanacetum coccineum]
MSPIISKYGNEHLDTDLRPLSDKIDPILEEFADELAHIAPIPPRIVEADFDPNDDTSSWTMILRTSIHNPTPDHVLESPYPFPIPIMDSDLSDTSLSHLDNSLTRNARLFRRAYGREELAELLLMANYTLPEYDSFLFEIEPDQEGLISIDNSNDPLLELPEFESFHFDPSFPRPPPNTGC